MTEQPGHHTAQPSEIRVAAYRRLHWLWPVLTRPAVARALRWAGWTLFVAWLLFVALVLALRYAVLPRVTDYRAEIEQAAGNAVGRPVRIGRLEARWQGLNPDLVLDEVTVLDRQGAPAFSLNRVEGVLSWRTLLLGRPILGLLAFDGPVLHVRRESDGKLTVAGLATEGDGDPAFARWVLDQKHIRIRNARIVWEDRQRQAPPLVLDDLDFALDNSGRHHRFGLSATPPAALAARIDMRGEVAGELGDALTKLTGKLFVELNYADLAGWRAWVDYPVHLPQGRGALRLWADIEEGAGTVTADLALDDVSIRLGKKLPLLDLDGMRGRLRGSYRGDDWTLAGTQVELRTRDGLHVAPTDFKIEWQPDTAQDSVRGKATASALNLAALARLASYMPLDAASRGMLEKYRPQGHIAGLRANWNMVGDTLRRYSLQADFKDLGVQAGGYFPGAEGLSGTVDCTEKGGELTLDSGRSSLSLPAVFSEPTIALDKLKAKTSWKINGGELDIALGKLEFAGPDVAGSAQGSYRYTGEGPGVIDLTARVDRADARAVWRYMPQVVSKDAREWLRRGLTAGKGYDGRLVLKGDLRDFPFRDGKGGRFAVTAKAAGVRVDYAPGWPAVDGVDADMSFDTGMKIVAAKGRILGAGVSGVQVAIPDFSAADEMLTVRGLAQGPTAEFLRYIERSPLAEKLDHVTDGMSAVGNGSLSLELDIPLRRAAETRVRADYRFQNNQLQPLPGLPPLTQVNGRLLATENGVNTQDLAGRVFGGPVKVAVRSAGDRVTVQAGGTAQIKEVSRYFGWPLINHLTGGTTWKADAAIRRGNADIVVDSDLIGVSSPLPEPLNKSAGTPLPLRIEIGAADGGRDQYKITLGKALQGLLLRRQEGWERGVIALGDGELRLPDKGLAIRAAAPRFDADLWRNYLPDGASGGAAGGDAGGLSLSVVTLKTGSLHLLNRDFNQVDLALRPREDGWQIGVATREANGDLFWRSGGQGWLEGNLKRLALRSSGDSGDGDDNTANLIDALPGMNLTVEDLRIADKALGRLELKARNEGGAWNLETLNLQNPDGRLTGKGVWFNGARNQTRLDFELTADDIGKLLDRLGYVDSVRRGKAKLRGDLQWNGPLTAIHYPSLTGQLSVEAEKGQFNKLEPGVGKLLGLLSLQSLPRRLTLDFRDIFSEGFAFDGIEGKLAIRQGIMRTAEPLRISGPAAQIEMSGETDLKSETQDLQVVVRPEIGNLAAVGTAALVNPVAGAAALVANTVLKKPLSRLFSYRYHVTGTWADPHVDKAGSQEPEHAEPPPPVEENKKP